MPDDLINRDAAAPPSVQAPPHIAEAAPMDMSVPIQELPSDKPSMEPSAQLAQPVSKLPMNPMPLSENVAPFNTPQQSSPEAEYVSLAPPMPRPAPVAAAPERPAAPPPRRAAVAPQNIRMPIQPPKPIQIQASPTPPVIAPLPKRPAPPLMSAPPAPQFITSPISSLALPIQNAKAKTMYSHNTKAVWHFQSSTRRIYIFVGMVVAVILGAIFMYWLSLGAPSSIDNIPIVRSLLNR